jgi:hypothetical protein
MSGMDSSEYDLIPDHITALLFICHVPNFTHFIMQMSPERLWYNGVVQFGLGGNLVCLCACKKRSIRLAHILGPFNKFGFKIVPSKWKHMQILVQTKQPSVPIPNSIRDFEKFPVGYPPMEPPSLMSLTAAAILAAGGSKRTVGDYRPVLVKKAYGVCKSDLILMDQKYDEFPSCVIKWHDWSRVQRGKHMSSKSK